MEAENPLVNRAADGKSAYVVQQKNSPIAWQLLDDAAISRAKTEDKLIFLHIGYSACHYSHLMTTETFSHPAIAATLNRHFIPIPLDRDARPDLDAVYMSYLEAVHAVGGWPLNVFLTPELEPVFGGTYWVPPNGDRHGSGDQDAADFLEILRILHKLWTEQRSRLRQEASESVGQLLTYASEGTSGSLGTRQENVPGGIATGLQGLALKVQPAAAPQPPVKPVVGAVTEDLDIDLFDTAFTHIASTFDPVDAGFTKAPKYVTAPKLSFLLKLAHYPEVVQDMVGQDEVKTAQKMAIATLRAINRSALHDHIGRGFSRASLTADWSLPFFEHIMAENALLLELFTDAWLATGPSQDSEFFGTIIEIAEYLSSKPLLGESGLLSSSQFADSRFSKHDQQTGPGAYFLWTLREFDSVLSSCSNGKIAAEVAAAYWNVHEDGNIPAEHDPNDDFVNRNVLRIVSDVPTLAKQFNQSETQIRAILTEAKSKLAAFRDEKRVPPAVSGNAVAGYNGLAIAALAKAGAALQHVDKALSEKYIATAKSLATAVQIHLWDPSAHLLYRLYTSGTRSPVHGFAEDYAYLIAGLLALYNVTLNTSYITFASTLQDAQITRFLDMEIRGGFFTADKDTKYLLLRLKSGMDSTLPAANGVTVANLFTLGELLVDENQEKGKVYTAEARRTVEAFEAELVHFPWLFVGLLEGVVPYRLGMERAGGFEEEVRKVRRGAAGGVRVVK